MCWIHGYGSEQRVQFARAVILDKRHLMVIERVERQQPDPVFGQARP